MYQPSRRRFTHEEIEGLYRTHSASLVRYAKAVSPARTSTDGRLTVANPLNSAVISYAAGGRSLR